MITQPKSQAGGERFYRYSYVDENGYTNSAVARYLDPDGEKPVGIYYQPAYENDSHLVFTVISQRPIGDLDEIEIDYLGDTESKELTEGERQNRAASAKRGCKSCITSERTSAGAEEITFKIELDEADDEVEGLEYAPFEMRFPTSSGLPTLRFSGIVIDDDGLEPLVTASPAPVLDLRKTDSCPSSQNDRLGSGGDVSFLCSGMILMLI